MAVKIRLSRVGTTNRPFSRIVVMDSRKKRDGAQLANIGTYDPLNRTVIQFHEDIYLAWLSKGAEVTDSAKKVYKLYKKTGMSPIAPIIEEVVTKAETTEEEAA